ncbi:4-alpha-glucanotransferase DPE2 [Histomonas meleagridis]|uniref:4-alpha-glucanotransferase DPE2 n=1 Tax=Histomonas meleagridis TaxID=135588 RepID=UPI0035595478|nr:4-alpha-glucanotransferase DPE2 [Histomonas meleagridis]
MPDLLEGELDDSLKQCMFYCWVQFQCHLQLLEITNYAIENRVILSSLMTIGQNFISADNWSHPEWFDKRYTIGAPPDIFSFNGQNWYYPAWDWGAMRESNFLWLRQQIGHREQYFQATMFDHPLGLFRCWNIPANIDNPLFGHFVPSIPINIQDLNNHQITDIDNLCVPYFPVNDILSINLPMSIKEKLISNLSININGRYRFRPDFKSDREVSAAIKSFQEGLSFDEQLQLKLASKIILSSFESICLIPDITSPHDKFYPRFSMTDSIVFKSLPEREAQILYKLFIDFYYRTNVSLWHEQGHQTLAVLSSSQMQFIGYDLGVSLNDEEDSLHQAGICSFRVQRVPRDSSLRFDLTTTFPYLSVCTPSTHDMQHLKLLWSNDQADVQQFYYQVLKMEGIPPRELTPEIAHEIIKQHLQAQSMWCLFQFEDLFAISPKLSKLISSDWINNPAKKHDWSYRINIKLEKLLEENQNWTEEIANLVDEAQRGRKADYGF